MLNEIPTKSAIRWASRLARRAPMILAFALAMILAVGCDDKTGGLPTGGNNNANNNPGNNANPAAPSIANTAISGITEGNAVAHTFTANGGTTPYSWAISGAPAWLSIDAGTGALSGTAPVGAAANSPFGFTVTVTDDANEVGNANVSLAVFTVPAPAAWESRGIGGGGALYSVSLSPHNASELFIATDMTTTYRSTDFGGSWTGYDFRNLTGGVNTHVRFTSDPQILYSITHLRVPMKSTDGGATWAPTATDPTGGDAFYVFADLAATERVIVGGYSAIYFSTDGGANFGSIWNTANGAGLHIAGVFWDGTTIYIGTNEGLLVSTNNGVSFALDAGVGIAAGHGFTGFCGAREGANVRLFGVTYPTADIWGGITGAEASSSRRVYSRNFGAGNWVDVTAQFPADAGVFFAEMAVNDIDVAYVAGVDLTLGYPIVFKTTNGGSAWSQAFNGVGNQNIATGWAGYHGDLEWYWPGNILGFGVNPVDANRVAFTDFGFVHVTNDGGANWRQAYVDQADENPANADTPKGQSYRGIGLQQTAAWDLHWATGTTMIASFTDIRGVRSTDGGQSWSAGVAHGLPHNTTYHVVEHPSTGALYAATSTVHDMYESTYLQDSRIDGGDGHIMISTDDGATFTLLHDFDHPVIRLAFDPNNSNTMYAAVIHSAQGGIFRTTNLNLGAGATWSKLANPPRTEGHPYMIHVLNDGTLVAGYSGRRAANGSFTLSSGVFVSTNGGTSWQDRSHADMQRWTKDVIIDPHDANQNTWYACVFSHWGAFPNEVGGIFRTTDRGQNWTRISDLYRVESITIDPQNPNVAWACTEDEGLWMTSDLTAATPTFTQDADYPFVHPTRVFYHPTNAGEIWVVSFGGGLHKRQ